MTEDLVWVQGEFVVTRRIPWETDEGLRPHVDVVLDELRECDAAAEIEVDADLVSARVVLSLTVAVVEDDEGNTEDGEVVAREAIASAIRSNGGRHEELLPLGDESRLEIRSGPWAGLRTPLWTLYRLTCRPVVAD
ncbi:MAG: hypothetical protein WCC01_07550 [Acidimicrobiia bacterium]